MQAKKPVKRRSYEKPRSFESTLARNGIYILLFIGVVSGPVLWYYSISHLNSLSPPASPTISQPVPPVGGVAPPVVKQEPLPPVITDVGGGLRGGLATRHGKRKLSILILCKDELESLANSMDTWEKGGVLSYADEVLVYFQGRNARKEEFMKPYIERGVVTRIIGNELSFPIGAAVNWLVGNATNPHVLFLEKDFALIEDPATVQPQLDAGLTMLETGEADVIRYRSRRNSGEPNFAMGMFQGREHVILMRQPNLYCSVHYWLTDEEMLRKPHPRYIWPCPATKGFWCTKAQLCNWTNNPQMYSRAWFLKRYRDIIDEMIKQTYPQSDLEWVMNWRGEIWNNADITVAMGEGLFTHREIGEHGAIDFSSMRAAEKDTDFTEDCDLGRRLSKEDCERHHCTWQPGHKTATCYGPLGRLEECEGGNDEASCKAIPRCFWNPWTVWLPSKCVRDRDPPRES